MLKAHSGVARVCPSSETSHRQVASGRCHSAAAAAAAVDGLCPQQRRCSSCLAAMGTPSESAANVHRRTWRPRGGHAVRCLSERETLIVVLVLTAFFGYSHARPIILPRSNMSTSAVSHAVDFLTKYGYLPSSDLESGNLRTENQLRDAIRVMQRFGNIPQTGVIDEATLQLMQHRRCGMPDLLGYSDRVKRYALQGQKWQSPNLTWSVKEPVANADPRMVRSQLGKAFKVWSDASTLTFTEVEGHKADILVSFLEGSHGDGYPFDGEGAVLAHAFFPGDGIGGDAHFDAEEKWLPGQPVDDGDGVNLFAVAAHEIGHSLGLSHSSTPGSLMFPYYQIVDEHFKLPEDDANGIRQLYGPKHSVKWATMPPISRLPTTSPSTTTQSSTKTTPSRTTRPMEVNPTLATKPRTSTSTSKPLSYPNTCNSSVDAISVIRREVFMFKEKYFWRLDANKALRKGYPVPIDRFWYSLPQDIDRVDALYERPTDTKIVFFSGKLYWLFTANQPEPGYPRPLTDLGLPADIEHIDAAMVWGHNGKTYFFSGSKYWKFDEADGIVELDYPRDMAAWRGVPYNIDAAFQWTDGHTYFFKGKHYWKFHDTKMRVYSSIPGDISEFWFGCPSTNEIRPTTIATTTRKEDTVFESVVSHSTGTSSTCWEFLIAICIFWHICIQQLLLL